MSRQFDRFVRRWAMNSRSRGTFKPFGEGYRFVARADPVEVVESEAERVVAPARHEDQTSYLTTPALEGGLYGDKHHASPYDDVPADAGVLD